MDTSKFKDVIRKLSFFKSYSSLLVPAIITLVAVLLLIVTMFIGSKIKQEIADESISKRGDKIKFLMGSVVSANQWREERDYQQAHSKDANEISLLAKQSTQRQLLSKKMFPAPGDTSALIFDEFGQRFRDSIEALLKRVNALDRPTEAELERNLQSSGTSLAGSRSRRGGARQAGKSGDVDETIMEVLCRKKAEAAWVYANPGDLAGYELWSEYKYIGIDEAIKDCWYWQLGYWIIEDVVETIEGMNVGSKNVFTSPVKRLLGVSFSKSDKGLGQTTEKPSYIISSGDGLTNSLTARVCNNDIDVVHFRVAVIVRTKAVLPFMQRLCSVKQHKFEDGGFVGSEQTFKRNQITILESKIEPVERKDKEHELYRYGEDAVVKLELICEYIFNKNGHDQIKPESIKQLLNKQQEPMDGQRGIRTGRKRPRGRSRRGKK